MMRRVLPAILLAAVPLAAHADDDVHGRLELRDIGSFNRPDSLDAAIGAPDHDDAFGNLRLIWEPARGHWSFSVHYVVNAQYGQDAQLMRDDTAMLAPPPATWFNLTDTFFNRGDTFAQHGIDRLSIAYSTSDFVIRAGRQALTWGSGFVFRPMDLFDPFSPVATDTEYKPGTDMLYAQFLFADGSDLQLIAVPRPPEKYADPTANASSFAAHYHKAFSGFETTWLVARDHGNWTGGIGVNGPLEGATWNVEFVPTAVDHGSGRTSLLANISDASTLFDRNATLFAEYFHNGFGVEGDTTFATLPADLKDMLARGELFNVRRDYVAAGLTWEWSPLVTISPTAIAGLNDGSVYLLAAVNWSLSDNLTFIAGAQQPLGPTGSEFGGLRLSPMTPTALSPASQIYVQLRRYF
jgi:hypothetical protein